MLVSQHHSDLTDTVTLEFPDVNLQCSWKIASLPWDAVPEPAPDAPNPPSELHESLVEAIQGPLTGITGFPQRSSALTFLYIYMSLLKGKELQGMTFSVRSTLPIGAGLGSSASVSVCIATAICLLSGTVTVPSSILTEHSNGNGASADLQAIERIDAWAFLGERCIHGNPSGIDNACSTRGGAVMFQRMSKGNPNVLKSMRDFPSLRLLLIDSKQPRRTAVQVANVATLVQSYPQITGPIMDGIHSLTDEAYRLLCLPTDQCDVSWAGKLRELVRVNHGLLVALGVSHPKLEIIRAAADELEIGETKLTGAGGGGCAITLVEDKVPESKISELRAKLSVHGFEVYETRLGGNGAGCLLPTNTDKAEWEKWEDKLFSLHHMLALENREHVEETVGVETVDGWAFW